MIATVDQSVLFQNNEAVKILIVENELEAKNGLVRMLARRFSNIYTAENGHEGLQVYQKIRPQIIITDIKMTPMNGLDMIKAIRKKDHQTQIIITTAHDENEYFIKAIEYGVNHFILKPIYQEQFLLALQKSVHQVTLEEQIKKQKLFTKTVLDFQEDLIITLNSRNELLDCNEAFLKFIGSQFKRFECPKHLNLNNYFASEQPYTHQQDFYEVIYFLLHDQNKKHFKVNLVNDCNVQKTFLIKATKIAYDDTILVVCTDISDLEEEIKKNDFLASRDGLTGTYNRYKFEQLLDQEIKRAKRYSTSLSLILLDIDYFKSVNDQYGHGIGDEVLKEVAARVQSRIRDTDIFTRWGGEEFIILTPETDIDGAQLLAEALREIIAEEKFLDIGKITSSFGVSQFCEGNEPKEFLRQADIALYQAKNNGRNCVIVYHDMITKQSGM